MQQLSLFDFGEQAPKPEKKKKASESSINQSESTGDKDNLSEPKGEVNEPATQAPVSSDNEQTNDAIPAGLETPVVGEAPLENSDNIETSPLEGPKESSPETPAETDEIENGQILNSHIEPNIDDARHEPLAEENTPESVSNETNNRITDEKPVDNILSQDEQALSNPDSSSSSDVDIANSDHKPGDENKVLFSNDQIRVKNVVVKSSKEPTGSVAATEPEETEAAPANMQQASASQPSSSSAIDTSFIPEELDIEEDSTKQHIEEEIQEAQPQDKSSADTLMEDDVVIPAPRNEDISVANTSENAENEEAPEESVHKRPYYIEDHTVPVRKRGRKSFKEIDAEVDLVNVPPDEELFQKQYYPISVVAKWFRVNNSLLRFWENEFKILKPKKNKKGDRFFRPEDVKNLQLIYYLLRQKKLTINGAIKHLKSYKEQTEVNMQLIQTLNDFKGFLLELRAATEK